MEEPRERQATPPPASRTLRHDENTADMVRKGTTLAYATAAPAVSTSCMVLAIVA